MATYSSEMTSRKSLTTGHGHNTRQAARLTAIPANLRVLTVTSGLEGSKVLPASSPEAQDKFLEGVGIVTTQVEPLEDVLNTETAETSQTPTSQTMAKCVRWEGSIAR